MMAPANESQSKSNGTTATALRPPEQGLKCPRCDSPNTKFCYYNNYSLAQPRHFCKTCRRYWTKGGALRNVPIGGGCRKSKKSKSSTASSCSSSSSSSLSSLCLPSDPTDTISAIAENCAAIKFLDGMDFQLGMLPFSRLYSSTPSGVFNGGHLVSFGDFSSPTALSTLAGSSATSMVGLNYPTSAAAVYRDVGGSSSTMNSNTHSSIASSIESLSSINQDLHWKLQQQRLAMLFGGENHNESSVTALPTPLLENLQESVSMQLQESSKTEVCMSSRPNKGSVGEAYETTAWFRESAYTSATTSTTNNINNNISGSGNTGNWNGIQTWNDMHQFTALP